MLTYFPFSDYKDKTIAVALSGGGDSMALLYYMQSIAEKFSLKIVALNVEHGIRGDFSLRDTDFVVQYCKENNIPFTLEDNFNNKEKLLIITKRMA